MDGNSKPVTVTPGFVRPTGLPHGYISLKSEATTHPRTDAPVICWVLRDPRGRYSGRRIVVTDDATGEAVFDSGDHYDLSNAVNAAEYWWLTEGADRKE